MFSLFSGNSVDPVYTKSLKRAEKSEGEMLKTYKKLNAIKKSLLKSQANEQRRQNSPSFFNKKMPLKDMIAKKAQIDKAVAASEQFTVVPIKYAEMRDKLAEGMNDMMSFIMDEITSATKAGAYSYESRVSESEKRLGAIRSSVDQFESSIKAIFSKAEQVEKAIVNKAKEKANSLPSNTNTTTGGAKRRRRSVKKVTKKRVTKKRTTKKRTTKKRVTKKRVTKKRRSTRRRA